VGSNSATYTDAGLVAGDMITCVMTSNDPCASPLTATSTPITVSVCNNPTAYNVTGGGAYCAGGTGVAVGLSNSEMGVTYQLKNSTGNVGSPVSGTGAAISFVNQTVAETYTVEATRTAGGCKATMTGSAVVSINSVPDVTTISSQTVCSNTSTTAVTFSGSVTGSVYKWTNNTTSIGLAASGTGDIAAFTATNTTSAPVTATITVTPSYTNGGVTCNGTPKTFTITVNPTPSVNTITSQTVCNATSTTAISFSSPTTGGTIVYKWTNNTTSIGLAASGTGDIAAFTATNTGTAPVTATITVIPSYTNGGVTCDAAPRFAETFTITVNPTVTVTTFSNTNQVVANNSTTTQIVLSSSTASGTIVYNWTNDVTSIGLAASGVGRIRAFTATNTTSAPVTATITVTPSYTNSGVTCTGTPKTFTITVNPTATVNTVTNQAVANNAATTAVTFSSPTTGGTIVYNWTNDKTSIGLAASGTGNIPSFTATNTTNAPITATVTVTPSYTNGGVTSLGTPTTFTITVNPTATVNSVASQAICNNFSTTAVVFSSPTTGGTIVYNWTNNTPSVGLAASGSGDIASFTGINTTNAPIVATITVTPSYTNAGLTSLGTPITFTITVNPTPRITSITPSVPLCQFGSDGRINLVVTNGTGTFTYNWAGTTNSFIATTTTPNVSGLSEGSYSVTATDSKGCKASSSTILSGFALPNITCPQPITVNPNQLGSDGSVGTIVSGQLGVTSACISVNEITFADVLYTVRCGSLFNLDGTPAPITINSAMLNDASRIVVRTFKATNTGSPLSYSCGQAIAIRAYKLADVTFPNNRILLCANSSIEPTTTGLPNTEGIVLGDKFVENLSSTYTDVRITNTNGFTIQRTWVAKDNCSNTTRTMVQNLTYTVGTCPATVMSISGKIAREDASEIPTNIALFNGNNNLLNSTTATAYTFNNLLPNTAFSVKPTRPNTDWSSGVTMLDVSLMSKHLLDIQPLNSPYKIIAADVNADGSVDATDMLLTQRLILRINSAFPSNNSWRFVRKNHPFQDPSNPFVSDFPEILVVSNLTNSLTNGDFVALKVGDVNESAGSVVIRGGAKAFMLNTEDIVLEKGKTYQIPIQLTLRDVSAVQFTLNVDKTAAKIERIQTGNLPNFTDNNTGLFQKEGSITAAWYRKDGQVLSETDNFTMMTVTLKPTTTTRLSEIMSINSAYTEGVAYDVKGIGAPVQLAFGNQKAESKKAVLLPNRPNPFSDQTTITFSLPEEGRAKVTVCDLLGKVLMTTERTFSKGINEVQFDAKEISSVSTALLVVRLQSETGISEQKIVLNR
jgi:hypothetical protein